MNKRELTAAVKEKRRRIARLEQELAHEREDLTELEAEKPDDPPAPKDGDEDIL
jgi:hypothetical protein